MSYTVKEIFYSLQSEGVHTGRPAVFCRFSGCNLNCEFCDTDFIGVDGPGGGVFESAESLATVIFNEWPSSSNCRGFVVLTGGEPLLQVDEALIRAIHQLGFKIAIETNGTLPVSKAIDWICVSPKSEKDLLIKSGNEIKLLYPNGEIVPEEFENLDFEHFYLQPIDTRDIEVNRINISTVVDYCKKHPKWKLSLQIQKIIGIK
ncbi:MAG: 7-carboxy-7-deazaguanine synthase [Planctomycetes bacterium]|nr:7-carboxy-7-deazaguanine synthase [Planctomycetota bacterium]